jgi:hypothetical protein
LKKIERKERKRKQKSKEAWGFQAHLAKEELRKTVQQTYPRGFINILFSGPA